MTREPAECPFCTRPSAPGLPRGASSVAFPDAHPIFDGHTLVVPERHVARAGDLTDAEWNDLWGTVRALQTSLAARMGPVDFNVGLNDGTAAGQTVSHLHVHVIPRRSGDVADPRGGIRWVAPEKAGYWNKESG